MKKIIVTLAVFASASLAAQQLPLYSQYYFNPFLYNPAMTGVAEQTQGFLVHRAQWTGIPGAPVTNALTLDGFIGDKNIGLGGAVFNDVQDINERLGIYSSYSYRLKINDDNRVTFGLSVGFLDNRIDFSKVVVNDQSDPFLFSSLQRKSTLDASLGVMYSWKDLKVGISVPQIVGQQVKFASYNNRAYYQLNRHYLGTAQYKFVVSEANKLSIDPLVMVRWVPNTPVQLDVNAILNWEDFGWFGVSYRMQYAVGVNARIKLFNSLSAGYAYDVILGNLGASAGVSHEFLLGYTFGSGGGGGSKSRGKYD